MNCVVGGPNVRCLAKAMHAMARIGDDVFIESSSAGVLFRTFNLSRSAYVCFTFSPDFFVQYNGGTDAKCKVSLKSCVWAFRSIPSIEKTVEKCLLDTGSKDCTFVVEFSCKHELTKVYHLPFIESESVHAAFQKESFQCELTAQTRLLSDAVQNFNNTVEEVTLTVCSTQVTLKNYVDDDLEQTKVVHTELTIEAEEFENYIFKEQVEVTFCLKELKAMLSFAEGFTISVTISCEHAGKPIVFNIKDIPGMEAEFVLATLAERGADIGSTPHGSSVVSQNENPPISSSSNRGGRNAKAKQKNKGNRMPAVNVVTSRPSTAQNSSAPNSQQLADLNDGQELICIDDDADFGQNEEMDVVVPSTPPRKKFLSEFLGLCSQTEYTSMMPDPDEILAEASDEDD